MSDLLYHVDGDLVPAGEATVSVRDRGFTYGDAAFETLRAYGGDVFEWDAHADRLAGTLETLGFADAAPPRDDLRARLDATLDANDLADAYLKLSVTRGVQPGKLTPGPDVDPTVCVYVSPLPRGGRGAERVWDAPAAVETVETRRVPTASIPADAKTHNYLNGILARLDLRRTAAGSNSPPADEALVLDVDGAVTEGATSNLFFVADGVLRTPDPDAAPLLPGVTRRVVLDLAADAGIDVETGRYGVEDVRAADEAFLTNTTWEIRPVASLDGESFVAGSADGSAAAGPVTTDLRARFDDLVERRHYG